MKKTLLVAGVLISSLAMAQNYVVEPKLGFDVVGSSSTGSKVEKNFVKRGGEFSVEGRTEVFENFEAGFGVAFLGKSTKNTLAEETKELKEITKETENYSLESKEKSFTSVPLYVTGKYKFDEVYGVKPYVKGKLGYAFNSMSATEKIGLKSENEFKGHEFKREAKNGIYLGLGTGIDYKNWTVDLSYNLNQFKMKDTVKAIGLSAEEGKPLVERTSVKTSTRSAKSNTVTLSVGYAFKF